MPSRTLTSLLLFAAAAAGQANTTTSPTVELGNTTLTGAVVADVESYRGMWRVTSNPSRTYDFGTGIPYAQPPVGSLRFQPTVLKSTLDTPTFNASQPPVSCLQPVRKVDLC